MKIVNNKGQTPLSLAVSHLKEETIMLIEEAEKAQKEVRFNETLIFLYYYLLIVILIIQTNIINYRLFTLHIIVLFI